MFTMLIVVIFEHDFEENKKDFCVFYVKNWKPLDRPAKYARIWDPCSWEITKSLKIVQRKESLALKSQQSSAFTSFNVFEVQNIEMTS